MGIRQIAGVGLVVLGAVLLYLGYTATDSFGEQISHTFTGKYSDKTVGYLTAGAVAGVVGVLMAVVKRP